MIENELQPQMIDCARTYIGTRFAHQGRLKKTAAHKGGIDCLGLLVGVADELGICDAAGVPLSAFDRRDYPHRPDSAALKATLMRFMHIADIAKPGDIVLCMFDGQPQHLGIISEWEGELGIIHAYAPAKAVVEHALDDGWRKRIDTIYRLACYCEEP